MKIRLKITSVIGFFLLVFLLTLEISKIRDHSYSNSVGQRTWKALRMGNALNRYRIDHSGRLPEKLSDLFPQYVERTNVDCFFWPKISLNDSLSDSDLVTLIDNSGSFTYLGNQGFRENLILYTRTNFWPTDLNEASVSTLTSNLTTLLRSPGVVKECLSNLELNSTSQP